MFKVIRLVASSHKAQLADQATFRYLGIPWTKLRTGNRLKRNGPVFAASSLSSSPSSATG